MITFSNTIELMTLIWLTILSAGYCETENSELSCTIIPQKNIQDITPRKIPAVSKCAKGHKNKEDIDKCEFLINRNQPLESKLFQPVINDVKNVVYLNTYCATCNNDTEIEFQFRPSWNRIFKTINEDFGTCDTLHPRIQRSEIDDIYNLTQIFTSAGVRMLTRIDQKTQLECSMDGKWPIQLLWYVIVCLIPDFRVGQITRLQHCQYAETSGRICTKMGLFMDGFEFNFNDRKILNYNDTLSEYKNFTAGQYYQETSYPGVFYICDLPGSVYGGQHSVKISIVVISLIFIIITLGLNMNKRFLQQNNTNKLLYLYMLGLVPMIIILLLIYLSHPVPCVAFYLAQFLWAYHFFWVMLIFVEFCLPAFCAVHNRIASDIKLLGLRYIVYFILGFAIPFALPIIHYFGILVLNENYKEDITQGSIQDPVEYTCPIIPNHLGVYCTSNKKFGSSDNEIWLQTALSPSLSFFTPVFFLSISGVVLFNFLYYRSTGIRSIPCIDHLIVLTKMGSIMGIHWVLFKIYSSYGNDNSIRILGVYLDTICQLSVDLHGIIVFILFGAEACIGNILNMFGCKYKSVSQQDRNNDLNLS